MRKKSFAKNILLGIIVLLHSVMMNESFAQCIIGCDDINVSVNNVCTATITPGMVLSKYDSLASCTYGIQLFDSNDNQINLDVTRADIGPQYVGQTLKIRIFEVGSNPEHSCWSYVHVEDKLPPDIMCAGNDTLECFKFDIFSDEAQAKEFLENKIENNLVDNCGNEQVTVNITRNDLIQMLCQNEFAAMRIVGYNVLNNNFDITSCEDTIYYERFPLDSLDAPKNYTGNMSIDCNDPYPTVQYLISIDSESPGNNSLPNINGASIADLINGQFVERGLCNFKLTYNDIIFETCGNTFKIVRNWTIIDWCAGNFPKNFNQVIKVVDEELNALNISNIGPVGADEGGCQALIILPFPQVASNECSNWTFTISIREPGEDLFFPFGGVRDSMLTTLPRNFPIGTSRVRYIITDACKNEDIIEFNVTVNDQEPPIPVCDFRTVVTLNDSFLGKVFAKSFDDGSFDHCSHPDSLKFRVRRMDRFTTSCETPDDFAEFVKFCCADIGSTVMVELEVTDAVGLTSVCMTEAMVQYKGPGPDVICPPNIGVQPCTVYEGFDIFDLTPPSIFSPNPCLENALTPQIREVGRDIDICGNGYIDVEWFYNITGDEEVICSYRILFANLDPFTSSDINWPSDRVVQSCEDAGPTAQELANLIGNHNSCTNVFASEPKDKIFDNVPNKCLFILRTWTVVDWCRYPADPNARWTYEQKISVVNSDGPTVNGDGSNLNVTLNDINCTASVVAQGIATDDCTPTDELIWTHKLDEIIDGLEFPIISEMTGRVININLETGSYVITWNVTDACGNTTLHRQPFDVADDVNPEAICGFIIEEIDSSNQIVVNANDLNNGSVDNCLDELDLKIRRVGDNGPLVDEIVFSCNDLGVNNVELWVTDESGNSDMCLATVDIRDSNSSCDFIASAITLEGVISTVNKVTVESAEVQLLMSESMIQSEITKVDGQFAFSNLERDRDYSLAIQKNDDYINGISTLDIILMQRHILGLQPLEDPFKILAADVNSNQSISAVDMVILRRLILGHIDEFPESDSWLFVPANIHFEDPVNPWPIKDKITVGSMMTSGKEDILAIKVGDLNATAIANSELADIRSGSELILETSIQSLGDRVKATLSMPHDMYLHGFQLALSYDQEVFGIPRVSSPHFEIVDEMLFRQDNLLRISVSNGRPYKYQENDILLEFEFAHNGVPLNVLPELELAESSLFKNEVYDERLYARNVQLIRKQVNNEVILYQNKPNPFEIQTIIDFEIPNDDEVTFELFDINGSRVYTRKQWYSGGRHQINLNRQDLGLNKGIYYYQIHTQQRSLTMKMIIL